MNHTLKVESSDGIKIAYDVSGSGPNTLVFVHGWSCNRYHWRNQVQEFSNLYRTIAIDLGGHGESGANRTEWSRQAFSDDVVAVLDQERVDRAVLLGHSMGGGVILYAARQLGRRVAGLIGADTFKGLRSDPEKGPLATRLAELETDFSSGASAWIEGMFSPESPPSLKQSVTEGMLSTRSEVGIGAVKGMIDSGPLFDVARSIDVPKFTINAFGSPADPEEAQVAGIAIRYVTTSGHFVMLEDPETFNGYLVEALEVMF